MEYMPNLQSPCNSCLLPRIADRVLGFYWKYPRQAKELLPSLLNRKEGINLRRKTLLLVKFRGVAKLQLSFAFLHCMHGRPTGPVHASPFALHRSHGISLGGSRGFTVLVTECPYHKQMVSTTALMEKDDGVTRELQLLCSEVF